jgi:hypothetical protein
MTRTEAHVAKSCVARLGSSANGKAFSDGSPSTLIRLLSRDSSALGC